MRLRSTILLRQRAEAGVQVCTAHGPACKKHPDRGNPDSIVTRADLELAEMARRGRERLGIPAPEPEPCKTRKLSDDELRKRTRYADAVRDAQKRKQLPPSWFKFDPELAEQIRWGRAEQARELHTQDVREGYGDTVPEFEEME